MKYPLAMTTDGKRKKSKMKKMKPDAFLKSARKLTVGEGDRDIIDKFKSDIKGGEPMGPLKLYADGTEDGRHRATAAKELDVDDVPVIDERTAKAIGGALASSDPNRFMQDILKFSFAIMPLLRPGYLKEVPKQGFAHGGHVLEDDYLPEVGRQVMADGGFAAMDPSMLVGRSTEPYRGGAAYTDVGGQEVASPFVSGMSGGYPIFDLGDKPQKKFDDLPAGKNPFEDWMQFNWLSKLMGRAEGGEVEGDVQFAPPDVEQALKTAREVAEKPRPFDVLPLSEDKEGIHFDPYAGLLGSITRPAKYFYETMSGQKEMEPTSEEAIRSATDLAGSLVGGSAAFERPAGALASGASRVTNPLGMHSIGAEAARAMPQEKGTPEQVLAMLRKVVPEHEIEHSDIAKEIAGLPSVNREDVAKHFESKLPQIQETMFSRTRPRMSEDELYERALDMAPDFYDEVAQEIYKQPMHLLDEEAQTHVAGEAASRAQEGLRAAHDMHESEEYGQPKFEQYSLPGGSNYREVVLHEGGNPPQQGPFKDVSEVQAAHDAALERGDTDAADAISSQWEEQVQRMAQDERSSAYSSSHFPEVPNYLAHMRMKDYELPEGGKGLLVDELQSDRAQQGRKKGFQPEDLSLQKDKINAQVNSLQDQMKDLESKIRSAYKEYIVKNSDRALQQGYQLEDLLQDSKFTNLYRQARDSGTSDLYDQMTVLDDMQQQLYRDRNKLIQTVPRGPYMSDTTHWTDLTLRRALKEAIEGGYDRLMITPGREQADRYNMRKHVSSITYSPDTEHLIVTGKNGSRIYDQEADSSKLEELIGKELAKRLIDSEPVTLGNMRMHALHDEGLELGGEGMKGFYDKTVPRRLDKLIKKYDKKVKIEPYQLQGRTVHSIPITPEMRAAFEEKGISAFRKGGTVRTALNVVRRGDAR